MKDQKNVDNNVNKYKTVALEIRKQALTNLSDSQIKEKYRLLKERAKNGESRRMLLPETFATVFEVVKRTLHITPFDSQLIAAAAMEDGRIIELPTGEGKTLVAAFVASVFSLSEKGAHILTFNDYLAKRDAEWMSPVYSFLGLTVKSIQSGMSRSERKLAYHADITYVTAKEAGFDYLKGFLTYDRENVLQRPFCHAILDEADSIMIDEARIPLVIAGDVPSRIDIGMKLFSMVSGMERGVHFKTDGQDICLTECGISLIEKNCEIQNLYDTKNLDILTKVHVILQAQFLLVKDIDYIVKNNEIQLVDEFTGRIVQNRQWTDGLHAAVEIKEGLTPRKQGIIMNSITIQNFLKLYDEICGMTGTACSAAPEFQRFYQKTVTVIPPHKTCIRMDHPDFLFADRETMIGAVAEEIERVHATGRPILVGTESIEESEKLAALLTGRVEKISLLNARNDVEEAGIISRAGMLHAVTISTNMAGRGVDIRLGGENAADYEKIRSLGGLYVIGTHRHESIRIDNQLRGRAGRQGDPGESRFFISLDQDLIAKHGIGEKYVKGHKSKITDDPHKPSDNPNQPGYQKQCSPLLNPAINKAILYAQKISEGQIYDAKITLAKYSFLIEDQRKIVHRIRNEILTGEKTLDKVKKSDPAQYQHLLLQVSSSEFLRAQRVIELYAINRCWADYLMFVEEILDGVQVISALKGDPLTSYNQQLAEGFRNLERQIDEMILDIFNTIVVKDGVIPLDEMGIKGPSSTRTYLIQDGTEEQALVKGISAGMINAPLYTFYLMVDWLKKRRRAQHLI